MIAGIASTSLSQDIPATSAGERSARRLWQDAAKGLGIFLVVLGHMERGLLSANVLKGEQWQLIDFALYTFHMPLFMFLAGVNAPSSLAKGGSAFRRGKVLTILYPYILWSLLSGVIMTALSRLTNNPFDPMQMLYIAWKPISPFWFLYALYIFLIVASFVPLRAFLALSLAAFFAGEALPKNDFAHQLLHFPLFFAAGMAMASERLRARIQISNLQALVMTCVWLVAVAVAHSAGFTNYNSVLMLPAAVGGIAAVLWLSQRYERTALLVRVGAMSMAIYVMHILAGAGARIVLLKFLHVPQIGWLYLAMCTVIGITAPMIAYIVMERLGLLPGFGLALGPRGREWAASSRPLVSGHTSRTERTQ